MHMSKVWEQLQNLLGLPGNPREQVLLFVRRCLLTLLGLQVLTASVLFLVAALGRRRKHDSSFPHVHEDEVLVGKNRLQLYNYGNDLYDAMLEAIENAQECVYIESFIWKDDEVGRAFRDRLGRKAEEGVPVYVIFDSFGNLVVPRSFKHSFHPSIHLLEYRTIQRPWHLFDLRYYALDHRKLLAVDGKIGFIGGYNIGSLYANDWRDTHLRIKGPAASQLAQSFVDFWNHFSPKSEMIHRRFHHSFDPHVTVSQNNALRLVFPIRDMYISAIDESEKSVFLTTAYFLPDHNLLDALKSAAQRGVDVRVLVPWRSNHILTDWIARSYFTECLRAGIRVFGYRYTMLHAKSCTIDNEWSTVGTANMDRLSLIGNYEINVQIFSHEFAEQMCNLFERDTADRFELTIEEWERRPFYIKVSEKLLAPWRFIM